MFVCCCLVAAGADDAMAQALPDAAYVDSQYSLLQLSTMAEQGDARAAYLLGSLIESGWRCGWPGLRRARGDANFAWP